MSYGWNIGDTSQQLINEERNSPEIEPTPAGLEISNNASAALPTGYFWRASTGRVPTDALRVGVDKDGGSIFVGRAFHAGDVLPAKVLGNHEVAYVAYDGEEHEKHQFEVLCLEHGDVLWSDNRGGSVPSGAVVGGTTSSGETLYIGRVFHDGTLTPGKVHPAHGACYISYDGQEHSYPNYEVLIIT